jgi:hypothetical protein
MGGGGVGLNILTYFVEECSGSEACMALFLGPGGQGFEEISRTGQECAWVESPGQCCSMQQLSLEQAVPKRVSLVGCPLAGMVPSPNHGLAFCLWKTSRHTDCVIKNPFSSNLNWLFYGYLIIVFCLEKGNYCWFAPELLFFCGRVSMYRALW